MIKKKLITKNPYSRPAKKLNSVKGIVLHWTATPKGTPKGVYNWFEGRKNGKNGYGSAHYCVGINGDKYQYIPDEEMAYHVGSKTYTPEAIEQFGTYPNNCTIGIEMCHMSYEGDFTEETWEETAKLTAMLLMEHGLQLSDITTHQKIVGWKECPKWFVTFPEEFDRFKAEVGYWLENGIHGLTTAKFGLNVRDGVMGKKISFLKYEMAVYVIGIKDGWYKIKFNDTIGYVSGNYLSIGKRIR